MKLIVRVLTVLLLAAPLAMGQETNLPFPQAANPALVNGERELPLVVEPATVPPAMASNEAGIGEAVLKWHHRVELGSPFPMNANPSMGLGTIGEKTPSGELELGSPFPLTANPSR